MQSENRKVKAAKVVGDLMVFGLVKGERPVEAVMLLKTVNEDENETWAFRRTEGLSIEELIGALAVQLDRARRLAQSDWEPE